jgi:hypothetical protein
MIIWVVKQSLLAAEVETSIRMMSGEGEILKRTISRIPLMSLK